MLSPPDLYLAGAFFHLDLCFCVASSASFTALSFGSTCPFPTHCITLLFSFWLFIYFSFTVRITVYVLSYHLYLPLECELHERKNFVLFFMFIAIP